MSVTFKQRYKPFSETQEIDPDYIVMVDGESVTTIPLGLGHWMERDLYQPWLDAGNHPAAPDA